VLIGGGVSDVYEGGGAGVKPASRAPRESDLERLPDGAPMFPGAPTVARIMAEAEQSVPLPEGAPRSIGPASPGARLVPLPEEQEPAGAGGPVDPEQLVQRVQELTEAMDGIEDSRARTVAEELTAAIIDLYGSGLERIVEILAAAGDPGEQIKQSLMDDGVVASLLLIHDLYPVELEDRVREALDTVRPYMESHGGGVELLDIADGVARLKLSGSCDGCPASQATLELAIKQALDEHAPDLAGFEAVQEQPAPAGVFELPIVGGGAVAPSRPAPPAAWTVLEGLQPPPEGTLIGIAVADQDLVLANVDGTLLAYANRCPQCGEHVHDGQLSEGVLACPGCARGYFLPRAGRSLDGEGLQLPPVPLLHQPGVDGIRVKVALSG
jgi:Fe-S cluster biogenesis protein NfuA/nitrite reductase/ring-hydroxylating ferredoxin subunit